MKLQRVTLKNINPFSQLNLDLTTHKKNSSIVILGTQQTAQTTLLKQTFNILNWFAYRHKDIRSSGILLAEQEMLSLEKNSSIEVEVSYPNELGYMLADTQAQPQHHHCCVWRIEKQRPQKNVLSLAQSELQQLDLLTQRYQQITLKDQHFSTPCIAYYPIERFVYEVNIQGKNTVSTLAPIHNAYDLLSVNFTTFNKFFEWFREVHDLENAQAAKLFKQYLDPKFRFELQENFDTAFSAIEQAYRLSSQRCISSVRSALVHVLSEVQDIQLEYTPKLALLVQYQGQYLPFLQLPQATRIWIGLVGDLVRRLCLLNPNSLYPCLEGEGIVLIDHIDLLLDQSHLQEILPRLQRAFPRIQFIVSSLTSDVIDNIEDIHCFQFKDHTLHPLDFSAHQQHLQTLYQESKAPIAETENESSDLELDKDILSTPQMMTYFQGLDSAQQQTLLEQLQRLQQLKEN